MHRTKLVIALALALFATLGLASAASAKSRDRNHDRIPDRWEHRHHLSLRANQAGVTRTRTASRTAASSAPG